MEWYKLIFKQNQPIHIGSSRWGVISETEIFIPGWTMWGALTNEYLKRNRFIEIEKSKKIFERITNFYPTIGQGEQPLFPNYKEGSFYLDKDYSEEQFKFEFVDVIVSTAVEPISRKANVKSLHEFEYILPRSKKLRKYNTSKELYWVGLIGLEDNINEDVKNFLKSPLKIYIGGDSKYGFGELELLKDDKEKEFKDWNVDENGCYFFESNTSIRQFLKFSPNTKNTKIKFEGEIKLLTEFDFVQATPRVQDADYYINVGSKILEFDSDLKNYQLVKGKFIKTN